MQNIVVEKENGIFIVKLNRPDVRNAINLKTAKELEETWANFEKDESLKVGIITSTSGHFCSGADLKDIEQLSQRTMNPNGPLGMTRKIPNKPVIAAISGYCVAGGLEIALWADIRICDETAKFGFLERRFGVPLIDGGTQRLPLISGLGNALYLITTGKLIDSTEALRMGIVSEVLPKGKVFERAVELAKTIAGYPQITLLSDREAVYAGTTLDAGIMHEERNGYYVLNSHVPQEGAKIFVKGKGRGGKAVDDH